MVHFYSTKIIQICHDWVRPDWAIFERFMPTNFLANIAQIFANFYCTFKITDSLIKFWKKLGYFYSSIWSHCPHPFPVSSKNVLKPVSGEDDDDDTVNFFHTSSSGTGKSEIPEMSCPPPLQIIRLILRVYHPSGSSRRTRNQSHKLVMLQKSFWSNEKNWSKKMSQEKVPDKYKMQCDRIWQNFATLAKC